MNIEEIEDMEGGGDAAVRAVLGTAFGAVEPPLRDLASGSIARGDTARRRNRMAAAGGAALSVVAVIGTFAVVAGTGGEAAGRSTTAAAKATPTPKPTPKAGSSTAGQPVGRFADGTEKAQDITMHLPGLLQPLLPAGVTIAPAPADATPLSQTNFLLTGPSGTTMLTAVGGKLDWSPAEDRKLGCLQQGGCEVHKVTGGTVYVNGSKYTAAEQAGDLKGALKPGTADKIVGQDVWMTYVPDNRDRQYLQIRQATTIAPLQYADKAPAGWNWAWPPSDPRPSGSDPHGVQLSADDFATLAVKPGIDKVETLLDPKAAVSTDAVEAIDARNARIAALLAPVLPAGVKASVTMGAGGRDLVLTQGSNQNELRILTADRYRSPFAQSQGCPTMVQHCDRRAVPGGQILTWPGSPDTKAGTTGDKPGNYEYWFLPDDTSQPAVELALNMGYQVAATTDPLITADQFVAVASKGQLVDIAAQVQAALKQ